MEAAAKTVEVLSKRILPETPHHLSSSPTWRHRPLPEDADDDAAAAESRGAKRRFEEWHHTRLQYLTFLSEADRGTLLTRSYYDMREEPLKPVPREVSALAKGVGTGEKKKLSLSDYKNKKTGLMASASPPEPALAKRKEGERVVPPTSFATSTPTISHADGGKPHQEPRRSDGPTRTRDSDPSSASVKPKPNRDGIASESRLPPKPASLPPRPPSPAGKRRMPDVDDDRSQKRPRPDERRLRDDRLQRDRDDVSRRQEKALPPSRDRDHRDAAAIAPSKDDRGNPSSSSSSSLLNGRSLLKGPTNSARNTSPAGRHRGDLMNGARPSVAGNNSSRDTTTKADSASTKSCVPPLLSPLHLTFDSREKEKRSRAEEGEADAKKEKERKWRDDADQGSALSKSREPEPLVPVGKKTRSTVSIPPLLSPTLPPVIEAELQRRKKASPDSSDERPQHGRRDAPGIKKRRAADQDVPDDVKLVSAPVKKLGHRRRLLVVLHVPKSIRSSFAKIVGHSAEQIKEPRRPSECELDRKPQAGGGGGGDEATAQPPARKRPMASVEGLSAVEATATKRPRSSDLSAHPKFGTPPTPSKKTTTAMSRVSSTNSVAQTPTESSADRRVNGNEVPPGKGDMMEARLMEEKQQKLRKVGTQLKHEADGIVKEYHFNSSSGTRDRTGESKIKRCCALRLESIIAFMLMFHAQNAHLGMYNKVVKPEDWVSMFPLMNILRNELRQVEGSSCQPLWAILLLLNGVCVDEIIKTYAHLVHVGSEAVTAGMLAKEEREKNRLWMQLQRANAAVQNPRLRVDVRPWSTLDDVAEAALQALRLWCAEEGIDWAQAQALRENRPVYAAGHGPGHGHGRS
ncbi:hypothetical protein E4U41_001458 [Claviceps citrina]|nr:hypothetical protein E4U41_001458 [Claviceps citrina]